MEAPVDSLATDHDRVDVDGLRLPAPSSARRSRRQPTNPTLRSLIEGPSIVVGSA
jgi:hypothetical protein